MADITVTAPRTIVEAPVSVVNGPSINIGVEVPERPELTFSVLVEPRVTTVEVVANSNAPPGNTSFIHTQTIPSSEWSVAHPFGSIPASLLLLDSSGNYAIPDTAEVSAERVVLLFGAPSTGTLTILKG